MIQTRYAFIIKAPGYNRATHAVQMTSPEFDAQFIGVNDADEMLSAAEDLVADGIQIIELCGGFTPQEATKLRRHFPGIDVGLVTYP
ncbi:DUF6506 family protein [Klebsiella sp. NPDC088457]